MAPVTVEVSGSMVYGSSAPSFTYPDNAPGDLSWTGSLSCSAVVGSTSPIGSLDTGSFTVDGTSCGGLSLSGKGANCYSIVYSGASDGFVVSLASQTITFGSTNREDVPAPVELR